jgi:hypothetical protein
MAIFKKQEKKNEKEEKDLQTEKTAEKVSLDDELLGSVAGGAGDFGKPPKGVPNSATDKFS